MLAVFSLGLAVPFLLVAFGFARATQYIERASKYLNVVSKIGGVFFIALGILLLLSNFGVNITSLVTATQIAVQAMKRRGGGAWGRCCWTLRPNSLAVQVATVSPCMHGVTTNRHLPSIGLTDFRNLRKYIFPRHPHWRTTRQCSC